MSGAAAAAAVIGGGGGGTLDGGAGGSDGGDATHTSLVGTALYLDPHASRLELDASRTDGGDGGGGGGGAVALGDDGGLGGAVVGGAGGVHARVLLKALDMYALGIVLFELNCSFATAMERHVTLMGLRQTGEVRAAPV